MTFKAGLSVSEINKLIKDLENYKRQLPKKCEEYVRQLAEVGIEVAQHNTGSFGRYITFKIKTEPREDGCAAILLATNTGIIKSEWVSRDSGGNTVMKSADVNPLLMVEFGSGLKAKNPKNIPGVGTGTFPGSTHSWEPGWWYATEIDENGNPANWHYSTGITPQQPMYKASLQIMDAVTRKAKEVFGKNGSMD